MDVKGRRAEDGGTLSIFIHRPIYDERHLEPLVPLLIIRRTQFFFVNKKCHKMKENKKNII